MPAWERGGIRASLLSPSWRQQPGQGLPLMALATQGCHLCSQGSLWSRKLYPWPGLPQDRWAESGGVMGKTPAGCRGPRRALLGAGQSCGRPWGLDNHPSFLSALTATATSFQGREQDLLFALHSEHLPTFLSPSVHAPLPCPSPQKHGPKPSKTLCPRTATLMHVPLQCQPAHGPLPSLPRPV